MKLPTYSSKEKPAPDPRLELLEAQVEALKEELAEAELEIAGLRALLRVAP